MEYDVIIVGSGAGGGTAAGVLAEAGKRVLVLERGRSLHWEDVPLDHLRNHRLAKYGHNTGPELNGNPRVFVDSSGRENIIPPHHPDYQNNAMTVGGGTLVYGAQGWRFMRQDFRMASLYGVPEGSSLADWPISYEDLEPEYDRAEWEIGCCGSPHELLPRRTREYPMPPLNDNPQRDLLKNAANHLGWSTGPVPLLVNSIAYNNRPACVRCGACIGFACPSNSKNGSQNTMIVRAMATGNCTLLSETIAEKIETNDRGKVIGVSYFSRDGRHRTARSKSVVVAGGAIETARLLLNSKSEKHSHGLGNHSDQVGRHLQGHFYPGASGLFGQIVNDCNGPGPSIATCQFNHGNAGIIGGGMLANEFVRTPIIFWKNCFPPGAKRWGLEAKQYMRDAYLRVAQVQGPVQEIPNPDARVTVDPQVKDKWGIPVARLSGTSHLATVQTARFMHARAEEWLRAAGAKQVWGWTPQPGLSGGQHQAGTCRMGNDPNTSVTDAFGRVHGHENLVVSDGSLHVSNGGFNPVLTIFALAFRVARQLAASG